MDFFYDHPIFTAFISVVIVITLIIGIVFGGPILKNVIFGGNRQIIDTKIGFHWAIIELGNGELLEGEVKAWNDYEDSDCVQIIFTNGNTILTHYSKVLLCAECP